MAFHNQKLSMSRLRNSKSKYTVCRYIYCIYWVDISGVPVPTLRHWLTPPTRGAGGGGAPASAARARRWRALSPARCKHAVAYFYQIFSHVIQFFKHLGNTEDIMQQHLLFDPSHQSTGSQGCYKSVRCAGAAVTTVHLLAPPGYTTNYMSSISHCLTRGYLVSTQSSACTNHCLQTSGGRVQQPETKITANR